MIGFIIGMIIYAIIYGGLRYLLSIGIFETEYYQQQYRTVRYVRRNKENKFLCSMKAESELVKYKKKWYQPRQIKSLPDKWVFDSEETKRIWERITND